MSRWSRHHKLPREEIRAYYEDGLSSTEIARKYSCSHSSICNILTKEFGLELKPIYELTIHVPENKEDLAYSGGILDGEGTITLTKAEAAIGGFRPLVSVGNNSKKLVVWLQDTFRGNVFFSKEGRKNTLHSWAINGVSDVLKLLYVITPYLKVKRQEAAKVMSFCLWKIKIHPRSHTMFRQLGLNEELISQRIGEIKEEETK